ncbi:MAG TPA: hypothetical protein PK971_08145, partial [Saprospiraceae bacterium]|nr:hypothetical protein [Saprospiraceae bacterium]
MVCMVCKKQEATVHLTQMVEGKIKKLDLCEACSKAKGIDDPTGFSLADLLMGLGASQELVQPGTAPGLACPTCGFTHADFIDKHGITEFRQARMRGEAFDV